MTPIRQAHAGHDHNEDTTTSTPQEQPNPQPNTQTQAGEALTIDNSTPHSHGLIPETSSYKDTFRWPEFSEQQRYDPNAPYNQALEYKLPKNVGFPLVKNLSRENFAKGTDGSFFPLYAGLPPLPAKNTFQWDSFPAGEAQQFKMTSVNPQTLQGETINKQPIGIESIGTQANQRPYTAAVTITPYEAGPLPHTHWAEDEWFYVLQGEIDLWVQDPNTKPRPIGEVQGQNGVPKQENFYYIHATPGQLVYGPKGLTHNYRNASPTKEPLVFLTIWSRDTQAYPQAAGGIEEFFTKPGIGAFADTAAEAADFGSFRNKNPGTPEAIELQNRLKKYKEDFPKYFVSMSGNFGDYLAGGGNWNPSIPEDYQPFAVPPPDPEYPPPAPNAPAPAVKFTVPLAPSVIRRLEIDLNPNLGNSFAEKVAGYLFQTQQEKGNIYARLIKDPSQANRYILLEQWQSYKDLDAHKTNQSGNQLRQYLSELGKNNQATITKASIDTINSDIASPGNSIVLVGQFQAKEGTREQITRLVNELTQKTKQAEGNNVLAFEFYEDPIKPNQYLLYEKYSNGGALNTHLTAQYTKEFFGAFSQLLVGKGMADPEVAKVRIETIHPNASPLYDIQKQGAQILSNLFANTPENRVSLANQAGSIYIHNQTFSDGVGINLKFSNPTATTQKAEYGIILVDDEKGTIQGIAPNQSQYLEAARSRARILFNSVNGVSDISRSVPLGTNQRYVAYKVTNGSLFEGNPAVNYSVESTASNPTIKDDYLAWKFSDGSAINVELNGPVEYLHDQTSRIQINKLNLVDTINLTTKKLDVNLSTQLNEGNNATVGLYRVEDAAGSVRDALTGQVLKPGDANYQAVALRDNNVVMKQSIAAGNQTLDAIIDGGFLYAPFVSVVGANQQNNTYLAFKQANAGAADHMMNLGCNKFGIELTPGGGDLDYNDAIIKFHLNFQNAPFAMA